MALQRLALAEAMDPACDAALRGDLGGVRQHLQAAASLEGYSINAKGTRARTPLYQACLSRSPEVAEWLLTHGAVDDDGSAYICICATGAERSADPGERTAAIMRRYGFSGRQKTSDIVRADGASGKQKKQASEIDDPEQERRERAKAARGQLKAERRETASERLAHVGGQMFAKLRRSEL
jgi:hypothetical protein